MKKKYEKPNLTMFSLVGNENICGGCDGGIKLSEDSTWNTLFGLDYGNMDGVLTRDEASNLFGMQDECSTKIDGYCKFTGSILNFAWS